MTAPTLSVRLVPTGVTDGDARQAVNHLWTLVERSVKRAAGRFADDPDMQEDLIQEAMIKLWELDPSRIDVRSRTEIVYVRRALINRMWDVVRAEW